MKKGRRLLITENAKTRIFMGQHEYSQRFFFFRNLASHKETMNKTRQDTKIHQTNTANFHGNPFEIHCTRH